MARVKKKKEKTGKTMGKAGAGASSFAKERKQKRLQQGAKRAEESQQKPAASNPYDVFQNRRRRSAVLGERTVRGEKRNIGQSRAVALQKRTADLQQEASSMGRRSTFKDGRVGGSAMDDGAQDVQRFVKLRQRQVRRTFNLDGSKAEDLTVGGRPLSGLADEELHAGGGGSGDEGYDDKNGDLGGGLDDVVARSKQWRMQEAREKQEQEDKLGDLDKGFTDIMGELAFKPPKALAPLGEKEKSDGYDQLVRQLGMERRATPTDRTKKPEEIAREKAEKLEDLERRRIARAEGIDLDDEDAASDGEGGGSKTKAASDDESADASGDDDGEEGEEESGKEGDEESDDEEEGAKAADDDDDDDDRQGKGCPELLSIVEASSLNIVVNDKDEDGLPFSPDCPTSAKDVADLLDDRKPKTALKLVQRVRTCTATILGAEKKAKLKAFFLGLLEYALGALAREDGDLSVRGVALVHALRLPLVELASEMPEEAYAFFLSRLAAMSKTRVPKASEFCCLKLITLVFPVTDLQHPICTPAAILADHWATNLAKLGAGIEELVSEGTMLWEILYQFCAPTKRFCSSFFQLGVALLESCWASAGAGRAQCLEASASIAALLCQALRALAADDAAAAAITARCLVASAANRLVAEAAAAAPATAGNVEGDSASSVGGGAAVAGSVLAQLDKLCVELTSHGLEPLAYFETTRAQIRVLDPIYHEVGDRPHKGMEMSETKQLQRKLTKERRVASRQLARDAASLQLLQNQKDGQRRVQRTTERKRVSRIMDEEKQMLKQLKTESGGGMDTSIKAYTAKKEQKRENKRVGGSATADTKKEAVSKPAEKAKAKGKKGKKTR